MSVKILLPVNDVDGAIKAFDIEGKEIALPHSLEVDPFFFKPKQSRPVLYLTVVVDDEVIGRDVISLLGASGKLRLDSLRERCKPEYEVSAEKSEVLSLPERRPGRERSAVMELDHE